MSIQTKFLKGKNGIVFIGLNATAEAVKCGSVFCTRVHFWNILKDAGFIKKVTRNDKQTFPFEHMAPEVFISGVNSSYNDGLGFTDIIDDDSIIQRNSNQVKVLQEHLNSLRERLVKAEPQKIVLLGKRVTKEFLRLDQSLEKAWKERNGKNNEEVYRYLGNTDIDILSREVKVYVVPFPETTPISEKHKYYESVLKS